MTLSASENIIRDLRNRVMESFNSSSQVLMNILDALTVGPRIATPFELVLSPIWGYEWSSLYRAFAVLPNDSLLQFEKARISWLQQWGQNLESDRRVGHWKVRILDSTNYDRPKTYVHGPDGMRPGHGLSEKVAEGVWNLPLEIALIPVESSPTEFGAKQVVRFVQNYGWKPDEILTVDAHYTNAPTLRPLQQKGVNVLGRRSVSFTCHHLSTLAEADLESEARRSNFRTPAHCLSLIQEREFA